jgi:hypothetical protein
MKSETITIKEAQQFIQLAKAAQQKHGIKFVPKSKK